MQSPRHQWARNTHIVHPPVGSRSGVIVLQTNLADLSDRANTDVKLCLLARNEGGRGGGDQGEWGRVSVGAVHRQRHLGCGGRVLPFTRLDGHKPGTI